MQANAALREVEERMPVNLFRAAQQSGREKDLTRTVSKVLTQVFRVQHPE